MRTTYTKELLERTIQQNLSVAECLRNLELRPAGANYKWFHRIIKQYELDISHFTGQAWNKGKKISSNKIIPLEEILVENSTFASSSSLRQKLIHQGIKQPQCEKCLNTDWNELPIPLELEHCNGISTDNRIENLKLLCPNCHAQTPHYRGRNKHGYKYVLREQRRLDKDNFPDTVPHIPKSKRIRKIRDITKYTCECGNTKTYTALCCRTCDQSNRQSTRPDPLQLLEDFKTLKNFVQVGKKYGVSDNAVRKWVKLYKIKV